MLARLAAARKVAQNRSKAAQDSRVRQDLPLRQFAEGELVYVRNFAKLNKSGKRLARKWLPKFVGPFKVRQRLSATSYRVQSCTDASDVRAYNVDDLKAFVPMATRSVVTPTMHSLPASKSQAKLPLSVPALHQIEEIIDKVLDVKMVHGVKYFLVHFAGINEGLQEWVPEDLVQAPALVQAFLSRKNRRSVPRSASGAPIPQFNTPVQLSAVHLCTLDGLRAPTRVFPTEAERVAHVTQRLVKRYH
jgi:hypothetical protein